MKNRRSVSLIAFGTIIVVIFLASVKLYLLANVFLFLSCLFYYKFNPAVIISLAVILFPTNGFYSTEYNVFGLFGPVTITQLFSLVVLGKNFKNKISNEVVRIALLFVIVLFLYNVIYDFRNAFFNIYNLDWDTAIKRLIKHIFRFGTLYCLVIAIGKNNYKDLVINSLHLGILILIFSSVFTNQLSRLGFLVTDASEVLSSFEIINRKSGYFAFGDVNSLGGLLATYFGFIFTLYYFGKLSRSTLILIVPVLFGIIYTGSRTAIISLLLIVIIVLITKYPGNKVEFKYLYVGLLSFAIIIFSIFLPQQVHLVFERFFTIESHADISNQGSRMYKWLYYLDFIFSNPKTLIIGTHQELYLNLGRNYWQARVPHNFYITVLFHSGIILLLLLFVAWIRTFKIALRHRIFLLIIIPTFLISINVSDWGYFQYFIIFLPIVGENFNSQKLSR